jgi:1-acyl-sn-glycerol-3-phosphate acyltransferase
VFIFRTMYFWFLALSCTLAVYIAMCFAKIIWFVLRKKNPEVACHFLAMMWAKSVFHLTPGWSISIEGFENLPPPHSPVIFISNHASMTDIFVIYFIRRQFRWLSKIEVFKIPVIGGCMKMAGYIPILRGDRSSLQHAMNNAKQKIEGGISMFFFPEGTRSVDGKLRPFKSGAFKLAEETGVAISPITLTGTEKLLTKGSATPHSAHVSVHIAPPMRPRVGESSEEFILRCRNTIEQNQMKHCEPTLPISSLITNKTQLT